MEVKKDCFAYDGKTYGRECKVLKKLNCENCSFFKTKEEFQRGIEKTKELYGENFNYVSYKGEE